jgi:hypothetical protein
MVCRLIFSPRIIVMLFGGCNKSQSMDSPNTVVEQFYTTYLAHGIGGLPAGDELEQLKPFLSDNLNRLIADALKYQERFIASHPDEQMPNAPPIKYKPPFVDGDYFSSLFEGPRSFKVARTAAEPNGSWQVYVHFWYDPSLEGWEDVIIVAKQRGRYVIDDVLFSGAGEFNPSGRLSDRLKSREE